MKAVFLVLFAALMVNANAFAYLSLHGNDPVLGTYDTETKVVSKATAAGYSHAISKGHALFYEDGTGDQSGLYQVSRAYSGTANATLGAKFQACIASQDVATGDNGAFPCVTRGYVSYAKYHAVATIEPIVKGDYLCIANTSTAQGVLVACASGVISQFIALESKASTADGTIKIRIKSE